MAIQASTIGDRIEAAAAAIMTSGASTLEEHLGTSVEIAVSEIREGTVAAPGSAGGPEFQLTGAVEGRCVVLIDRAIATSGVLPTTSDQDVDELSDDHVTSVLAQVASQFMVGVAASLSDGLGTRVDVNAGAAVAAAPGHSDGSVIMSGRVSVGEGEAFSLELQLERTIVDMLGRRWPASREAAADPTSDPSGEVASRPSGSTTDPVSGAMAVLGGVQLPVAVELGSVTCSIGELLRLAEGSVIPLRQGINEKATMLVNGTEVARGEMVVVDKKLGFRITETNFSIVP